MKPKTVAIVGAAETTELGKIPDMSQLQLHADAALNALADAGLGIKDIDGVATAGHNPTEIAHYLGITPTWVDGTAVGGCSFMVHVRHAAAAINEGLCDTVLITHGESGRHWIGRSGASIFPSQFQMQFEQPGLTKAETVLEPMAIGAGSYGSYIKPQRRARYLITLRIKRAHATRAVEAKFEHRFE